MTDERATGPVDLQWGPPPPQAKHGNRHWKPIADALRARPGEWARIATYEDDTKARALVGSIRYGMSGAWHPRGHFDAARDDGAVWARYTGKDEPQ